MIEILRPGASAASSKVVIFDFDGTLSLIRTGWIDIMIPLCLEQLTELKTGEPASKLTQIVQEFVSRLTGKETIYQMMALADAIRERGGEPLEPRAYKKLYLDRLSRHIQNRIDDVRTGKVSPDRYLVPGAREWLERLRARGLQLYLASGTDDADVKEEAALLDIARYFEGRVFGAQEDLASFSKALLVQQIVSRTGFRAQELLVFGDGFVEIEEVKKAGGVAVGVATAEPECVQVDGWKRERLVRAGADFIVPNFTEMDELVDVLFSNALLCDSNNAA